MFDDARLLDLIERTIDTHRFCRLCNAPNDIRDHDGLLWLECSTTPITPPTRFMTRLGAALSPHPRLLIADLREDPAA
jgi:hypothetical protein